MEMVLLLLTIATDRLLRPRTSPGHKDLRVYVASKVPLDLLVYLDPSDHLADQDLEAPRESEESLVSQVKQKSLFLSLFFADI